MAASRRLGLLTLAVLLTAADAGVTSAYRRKLEATADMPLDADVFRVPPGYNAPQQVHITLGDQTGTAMTVSWVTPSEPGNGTVAYGRSPERMELSAQATLTRYDYFNYTSGFIHHCTLTGLRHGVKYFYAMGFGHTVRTFWFTAPPKPGPDVPFKFGLIETKVFGGIGQDEKMPALLSTMVVSRTLLLTRLVHSVTRRSLEIALQQNRSCSSRPSVCAPSRRDTAGQPGQHEPHHVQQLELVIKTTSPSLFRPVCPPVLFAFGSHRRERNSELSPVLLLPIPCF